MEVEQVVCSRCGQENPEGGAFCSYCGSSLRSLGSMSSPALVNMNDPARGIADLIESKERVDRKMSRLWALVPGFSLSVIVANILIIIQIVFFFHHVLDYEWLPYFIYGSYLVGLPLFGVLFGLMLYKMIRRLNEHIAREDSLRVAVMTHLRNTAEKAGKEQQVLTELLQLSAFDGQALVYEKKHNPRLWGFGIALLFLGYPIYVGFMFYLTNSESFLMIFVAILGGLFVSIMILTSIIASAYIINSLMRTIYTHDVRWNGFATSVMMALRRLGKTVAEGPEHRPLQERSTILYVVLTLLTLGFFLIYWFYVLVDDPNKHFDQQHRFEDTLLAAVKAD